MMDSWPLTGSGGEDENSKPALIRLHASADLRNTPMARIVYRLMPPPGQLAQLVVDQTRAADVRALIREADLIVQATPAGAMQTAKTGRYIAGHELVHYAQALKLERVYKGTPPQSPLLVTAGLEPLPPAHSPMNDQYSGPLADGETYVLFLHATSCSGCYAPIGGWQGIYPLDENGKTLTIEGQGFLELARQGPEQLTARIAKAK